MHVRSAQVQRPGDVVERRHQHTVGVLLAQSLADTCNLVVSRLAGKLQRLKFHLVFRNRWTVCPNARQYIQIRPHRNTATLTQISDKVLYYRGRRTHSVDTHLRADCRARPLESFTLRRTASRKFPTNPLGDGGCVWHLHAHQLELRALQLLLSRQEIATVRPQGSAGECHHGRASRPVEATYPLASLPMVSHVFTLMRIGAGEDKRPQSFAPHLLAQRFQSFFHTFHGCKDTIK